ncbi:Nudix family hydrolase [Thiomicrorhabdus sp. zzn3]|uniref:Nudix family hydrolase n=1 Tax=Thiomicrorhabdus sp. zzn3 TaxID=3039775 RepID=UPI0024365199|nr:Nudix family hydrolase [Thiomicrorhabdus sp. zzn3]MDG6778477.1 Nudix family hydrolase [Thiomicrorhabdus sp. zzn3]
MTMQSPAHWVEVAIGLLKKNGAVCLSQRQSHQHLSGHWEFPGGKIEANETLEQALQREFAEELGVQTENWRFLMTVPWHYNTVSVRLHVFTSDQFGGEAHGKEGQKIEWCPLAELDQKAFPPANRGILTALRLPDIYLSIGGYRDADDCLERFRQALEQGVRLAQFKYKEQPEAEWLVLASDLCDLAHQYEAKLLLNAPLEMVRKVSQADGIQLSSKQAKHYQSRPLPAEKWLCVSTHNIDEMQAALDLEADFLQLSPVKATSAHPDLGAIGWEQLKAWIDEVPIPVYALGGMTLQDVESAKAQGAQGVALTRGIWPD